MEYTRVVSILGFWICQGYTRFWIKYFMIDIWQYYEYALYSKYARVLNMLRLLMVLSKFTIIDIWHGSEYACVIQGSVQNGPSYMLDRALSILRVINLGHEYTKVVNVTRLHRFCVNCILKIHSILNVLSSQLDRVLSIPQFQNMPEFWIYLGSEYGRVLNMPGLHSMIDISWGSEYAFSS